MWLGTGMGALYRNGLLGRRKGMKHMNEWLSVGWVAK